MANLQFHSIETPGHLDTECVWLEVTGRTVLTGYVIAQTTYFENNNISTTPKYSFWFPAPARTVESGDLVKLMTRAGTASSVPNNRGTTTHVYYWHQAQPIWTRNDNGVLILELSSWKAARAFSAKN